MRINAAQMTVIVPVCVLLDSFFLCASTAAFVKSILAKPCYETAQSRRGVYAFVFCSLNATLWGVRG